MKKKFLKLRKVTSDDGENFKELYIDIMNIKECLRGIHHDCSKNLCECILINIALGTNRRLKNGNNIRCVNKRDGKL